MAGLAEAVASIMAVISREAVDGVAAEEVAVAVMGVVIVVEDAVVAAEAEEAVVEAAAAAVDLAVDKEKQK